MGSSNRYEQRENRKKVFYLTRILRKVCYCCKPKEEKVNADESTYIEEQPAATTAAPVVRRGAVPRRGVAVRPAPRPVARPAARPVARPAARPVAHPAPRPVVRRGVARNI